MQLFTPRYWFADAATIEIGGEYGMFLDLSCFDTISKYKGILAHELGHCAIGCMQKVSSPLDLIGKHVYKANQWAIERYIPFESLKLLWRMDILSVGSWPNILVCRSHLFRKL